MRLIVKQSSKMNLSTNLENEFVTSTAFEISDVDTVLSSEKSEEKVQVDFSKTQSKIIHHLRWIFFIVLLLSGSTVSVIVYFIAHNGEENEFENQFNAVAERLINAFTRIPNDKFGSFGSLRVAYTAQARDTNSTWPFVALSSFQQRATTVRRLSGAFLTSLYPVVDQASRDEWEKYAARGSSKTWMKDSLAYQQVIGLEAFVPAVLADTVYNDSITSSPILEYPPEFTFENPIPPEPATGSGPWLPTWQSTPFIAGITHLNAYKYLPELSIVLKTGQALISGYHSTTPGNASQSSYAALMSNTAQEYVQYNGEPVCRMICPVFKSFNETDRDVVAIIMSYFEWTAYFRNILSVDERGIFLVMQNGCDDPLIPPHFTYYVDGKDVKYLGQGDLHDIKFDYLRRTSSYENLNRIQDGTEFGMPFLHTFCPVQIHIYPSQSYHASHSTNMPKTMTFIVMLVFVFTGLLFLLYDRLVERRQYLVLSTALRSSEIVSSLFPQSVADRLMKRPEDSNYLSNNKRLKSFLGDGKIGTNSLVEQPIAELYPYTTVLFADIVDFTAWSSSREPSLVFILLQSLYQAFDAIAKRRRVFKVETIGDCYVAVAGLPDPQEQHAVIMARFATECRIKMVGIVSQLGLTLGPGTSELRMRYGLHSGSVTAGVLLGDRARFQLFGDTVNTAARMESTGLKDKIHVSSATAALLTKHGKSNWIEPRNDTINVKGKGILNTFWLKNKLSTMSHGTDISTSGHNPDGDNESHVDNLVEEKDRLVGWICELIQNQIKNIIATRTKSKETFRSSRSTLTCDAEKKRIPMDEVVEAITLPDYNDLNQNMSNSTLIELDIVVKQQLFQLISSIASTYKNNPFHNFEHACHVTMSVSKLLSRVVTPDLDIDALNSKGGSGNIASHLYDYTHGINSDAITLLAILFSAVIHDSDHQGISNVQLAKEAPHLATMYCNKSIAEQNSLDISWNLLMSENFSELRECMFATDVELKRFRQVLVNVVLATDIFDKELNDLRKKRWEKAFSKSMEKDPRELRHLRATIVIEHIMQASDVSHTMQHWNIYRRWNARLFRELYLAYRNGRMSANPCDFWYEGELGFFDNYIIPLTKKLKDCNVFGVSSDEYLNYAQQNRLEWEVRGKEIVAEMVSAIIDDGMISL